MCVLTTISSISTVDLKLFEGGQFFVHFANRLHVFSYALNIIRGLIEKLLPKPKYLVVYRLTTALVTFKLYFLKNAVLYFKRKIDNF